MTVERPIEEAKILIVDDQRANVVLLEHILYRNGYTSITSTSDARQVLALCQSLEPDIKFCWT